MRTNASAIIAVLCAPFAPPRFPPRWHASSTGLLWSRKTAHQRTFSWSCTPFSACRGQPTNSQYNILMNNWLDRG
jgi:hypothetical protein